MLSRASAGSTISPTSAQLPGSQSNKPPALTSPYPPFPCSGLPTALPRTYSASSRMPPSLSFSVNPPATLLLSLRMYVIRTIHNSSSALIDRQAAVVPESVALNRLPPLFPCELASPPGPGFQSRSPDGLKPMRLKTIFSCAAIVHT